MFGFERVSGSWQHDVTNLRHAWAWSLISIHDGEWWRLVTPAVLHSDVPSAFGPLGTEHLVANLLTLIVFGPRIERRVGPVVLLVGFFSLHLAAFSVWAITQTPGSYFGVGASGAIVAFAVAAVIDAARRREWRYAAGAAAFALWWWWPNGPTSSDQVHLGGAVAGAVFGVFSAWPWLALAAVAVAGCVVTATARPDLPAEPSRLACPDAAYAWSPKGVATLFVRNEHDKVVDLYWVRPDGQRDFLASLLPNEYVVESSYKGHRFVSTTDGGVCLDVWEAR
jgi:membrane associated rhomboid family serine protease